MHIAAAKRLACPMDGLPLTAHGTALQCANGHSYDRAREGYWNLLLVQHKASLDPGDNKAMVGARRRFLEAGHYAPVAEAVYAALHACVTRTTRSGITAVVDAGCGEGYYLEQLAQRAAADSATSTLQLAGYDISKWAVQAAAKRTVPATWLVATSSRPPFVDGCIDVLLCLFGFPLWECFKRVQPRDGCVLLVDPGPDHLLELRERIYPSVGRAGPPSIAGAEAAGYQPEHETRLRFLMSLDSQAALQDLVAMTPHAYRMPAEGRTALAQIMQLTVTVDVVVRVLRRV